MRLGGSAEFGSCVSGTRVSCEINLDTVESVMLWTAYPRGRTGTLTGK